MEFRSNIIFSLIVHASIAMMTLSFAGRNDALSRFPKNYIAVSLLEYTNEKNPKPGDTLTADNRDNSKKPELKSQKVRPLGSDRRIAPQRDEKKIPWQYPKNDPLSERRTLGEGQYPNADGGKTPGKVQEQRPSLQGKAEGSEKGLGDNQPTASSSGSQAIMPGSSIEVRITRSNPTGGGVESHSLINQIRASIEKAKGYPILAKKRGREGSVIMEFSINGKGWPENIRIVRSSGIDLLDTEARDTIIRAAPFPHVKGAIEIPITFRLRDDN